MAGAWLNTAQGGTDAFHRLKAELQNAPFDTDGTIGEAVVARTFSLTVEQVQGSTKAKLQGQFGSTAVDSGSVFVVVTAVLAARTQSEQVSGFVLRDDRGREFAATRRWSQAAVGVTVDPRLPTRIWPVFEVPPDAAGLQLLVSAAADSRLDSRVVVPLGITDRQLTDWSTSTTPVTVPDPETLAAVPGPAG